MAPWVRTLGQAALFALSVGWLALYGFLLWRMQ